MRRYASIMIALVAMLLSPGRDTCAQTFVESFDNAPDYTNNWTISWQYGTPLLTYTPGNLRIQADPICLGPTTGPSLGFRSNQTFTGDLDLTVELNHQGYGRTSIGIGSVALGNGPDAVTIWTFLDTDDTNYLNFVAGSNSTEWAYPGTPYMNRWVTFRIQVAAGQVRYYADGSLLHTFPVPAGFADSAHYVVIAAGSVCWKSGANDTSFRKVVATGSPAAWTTLYGGPRTEELARIRSVRPTDVYYLAGTTTSFGFGKKDYWVLKLSRRGEILWQRSFGGPDDDITKALEVTHDGGCLLAGTTRSFGSGGTDIWIIKLAPDGTIEWQKTYGGKKDEDVGGLAATSDGGYILAGTTESFGAGRSDMWLVKLDATGADSCTGGACWQRTYGTRLGKEEALAIDPAPNGEYTLAGTTQEIPANERGILLRLDSLGLPVWSKVLGYIERTRLSALRTRPDGSLIVAGSTNPNRLYVPGPSFQVTSGSILVLMVSPRGMLDVSQTYTRSDSIAESFGVELLKDGGFVVGSGLTPSSIIPPEISGFQGTLLRFNAGGGLVWQRTYGPASLAAIATTVDDEVILATAGGDPRNSDLSVSALDDSGTNACRSDQPGSLHETNGKPWLLEFGFSSHPTSVSGVTTLALVGRTSAQAQSSCATE